MRTGVSWLLVLLALPAARGQDGPKKEDKPPTAAKAEYDKLVKELADASRAYRSEASKTSSEDATRQLREKLTAFRKSQAEKLIKLAEGHPTDPAAASAVFYVIRYLPGDHPKAAALAVKYVGELPVGELARLLGPLGRTSSVAPDKVLEAVLTRAEKDAADPLAGNLLAWMACQFSLADAASEPPLVDAALDRLLTQYPEHAAWDDVIASRTSGRRAANSATLRKVIEKASSPRVKAVATFSLGQGLIDRIDTLNADGKADEAEKLMGEADRTLADAVTALGKANATELLKEAERILNAFRTLRVGKTAPDISGKDLDGTAFKLSDYRGKVVLLDFWGNW